eukprot:jgi/Mesvir1/8820/Mv02721-RA.1
MRLTAANGKYGLNTTFRHFSLSCQLRVAITFSAKQRIPWYRPESIKECLQHFLGINLSSIAMIRERKTMAASIATSCVSQGVALYSRSVETLAPVDVKRRIHAVAARDLPAKAFFSHKRAAMVDFSLGHRSNGPVPCTRQATVCKAAGQNIPPTVADSKAKFLEAYPHPIPAIFNGVIQELIVQQHLIRYAKYYTYNPVFACGVVTIFDQLMDGYDVEKSQAIFAAYIRALNEDPQQYKTDSEMMQTWARTQSSATIAVFSDGNSVEQKALTGLAAQAAAGEFHYNRFFAVGMFRLLELSKSANPDTLGKMCKALNIERPSVDRDLDTYRGLLSKLKGAKELLKEYIARERKKAEERAATKQPEAPPAEVKEEKPAV